MPHAPIAPTLARASLRSLAPRLGPDRMSDLLLLTTELVTNAVRHGGRPGSEIDVTLLRTDTAVRVEVGDPGPGFDPGASAPGHDRGWGLFLVDRLADRWGVERIGNRTVVWFELAAA